MAGDHIGDPTAAGTPVPHSPARWRFINIKSYVVLFSINILLITVIHTYLQGMTTYLEKQFNLSSQDIGIFTMAYSISIMPTTLILSYVGKNWNHARIVGMGACLYCVSCLLHTLPHAIYGTSEFHPENVNNHSDVTTCYPGRPDDVCEDKVVGSSNGPLILLFLAGLTRGISQAPYYSLGFAYTYRNAENPKVAAIYIGIVTSIRGIGGFIGFWTAALFSAIPIDLKKSSLKPGDPFWLGAWWVGLLGFAVLKLLFGIPLLFFPKTFKKEEKILECDVDKSGCDDKHLSQEKQSLFERFKRIGFVAALTSLLGIPLYFITVSAFTVVNLRLNGLVLFSTKVINVIFKQSALVGNVVNGIVAAVTAIGSFLMGYLSSKLDSTRRICYLYFATGAVALLGAIIVLFLGCNSGPIEGALQGNRLNMTLPCNTNCNCETKSFQPVCGANNTNFFSPCHAGCHSTNLTDCSCGSEPKMSPGWCPADCPSFVPFVIVTAIMALSYGISPGRIIMLRVMPPDLTAFGLAFNSVILNLLAGLPAGILFGSVVDSTCVVWRDMGCGQRGTCWIYNNEQFWYRYKGLEAGLIGLVFILTAIAAIYAKYYIPDEKSKDDSDAGPNQHVGNVAHENKAFEGDISSCPTAAKIQLSSNSEGTSNTQL